MLKLYQINRDSCSVWGDRTPDMKLFLFDRALRQ